MGCYSYSVNIFNLWILILIWQQATPKDYASAINHFHPSPAPNPANSLKALFEILLDHDIL